MNATTIGEERMATILKFLYFGTSVEIIDQRTGGDAWDKNAIFSQMIRVVYQGSPNTFDITQEEARALIYFQIVELDSGSGDEFSDEERRVYLLSSNARTRMDDIARERKISLNP
jgi:hypothetical protein